MLLAPPWISTQPLQRSRELLPERLWYERRHRVTQAGIEDYGVSLAVHVQVVAQVAVGRPLAFYVGLSLKLRQIRAPVSSLSPLASRLGRTVRGSHPLLQRGARAYRSVQAE